MKRSILALMLIVLTSIMSLASLGNGQMPFLPRVQATVIGDVKFQGQIVDLTPAWSVHFYIQITKVLLDPGGYLTVGEVVFVYAADDRILDSVVVGDLVEVYGVSQTGSGGQYRTIEYDITVYVYVSKSPYYVKKINGSTPKPPPSTKTLQVDVYTNKGGKGLNVGDGRYEVGESVGINYYVSDSCQVEIDLTDPYGSSRKLISNYVSAGTYSDTITAEYPVGQWTVVLTASSQEGQPPAWCVGPSIPTVNAASCSSK